MIGVNIPENLYDLMMRDLSGQRVEHAGFFLADFNVETQEFEARQWRPVPRQGFERQSAYHIALTDTEQTDLIQWAWHNQASLIEIHTHLHLAGPRFSPSDMEGLREWVPHLFWRLRRAPYAALVLSDNAFDGLAWVGSADQPLQIESLQLSDGRTLAATKKTLDNLKGGRRYEH